MHKAIENESIPEREDLLGCYFNQVKRIPLIGFEEELELSRRIQEGDEDARQRLIEANLRLVVKIAKGYMTSDVQLIDLIQEGNIGLIKASTRYDHSRQVRFSTYAAFWIKQSIIRALSEKRRTIRIPLRKEEQIKRINGMKAMLTQRFSREPSLDELAAELKMQPAKVSSLMNIATTMASLETEMSSEPGMLLDMCEDFTYTADKQVMEESAREETNRSLDKLLDNEKKIIKYRFEFQNGKKYTLKTIGKIMGVSPETVRQIEVRALKKLRSEAKELRDYIYN